MALTHAWPDRTAIAVDGDGGYQDWSLYPRALGGNVFASGPHPLPLNRVFGGRLFAEAMMAASQTAPQGFTPHSLSGQFMRPVDVKKIIRYEVETLRDSRGFASRCVRIVQDEALVAMLLVSLASARPSPERSVAMPDVPAPDSSPSAAQFTQDLQASHPRLARAMWSRTHPIEVRPVDGGAWTSGEARELMFWFRATPTLPPDDHLARAALLAYASDRLVLTSSLLSRLDEVADHDFTLATVSHSLWLHRDYAPGSWILCHVQHRALTNSRAFMRGEMFSATGEHLASMGQEGLAEARPVRAVNSTP